LGRTTSSWKWHAGYCERLSRVSALFTALAQRVGEQQKRPLLLIGELRWLDDLLVDLIE
jgi:hypothetical protein